MFSSRNSDIMGVLLVVMMAGNTCSHRGLSDGNRLQGFHATSAPSCSEPCAVF